MPLGRDSWVNYWNLWWVERSPFETHFNPFFSPLLYYPYGASLYFHHRWDEAGARARSPFEPVKDHVLLPWAEDLVAAGARLAPRLGRAVVTEVLADVPDAWLGDEPRFASPEAHRAAYADYLERRLEAAPIFLEEALRARLALV